MSEEPTALEGLPRQNTEAYIGDGLYISFDGWQLKLRAPRIGGDHFIALEPNVYQSLLRWVNRYPTLTAHMNSR